VTCKLPAKGQTSDNAVSGADISRASLWRRGCLCSVFFGGCFCIAYILWLFFSFFFVPFPDVPYEIRFKHWPLDGYYKMAPGVYENPKYRTTYSINRHGFRGVDFDPEKPRGFRIVAIGESSTIGLESNDDETWPSRLEAMLSSRGYCNEVVNAGIGGTTSANHLAMLRQEVLRYRPNMILYYGGRNDHAISAFERYPGPKVWPRGLGNFLRHWFMYKRVQIRLLLLQMLGVDLDDQIPWTNRRWTQEYQHNLEQMILESKDVPFVVITQFLDYPLDMIEGAAVGHTREVAARLSVRQNGWQELLRHVDLLRIQRTVSDRFASAKFLNTYSAMAEAKRVPGGGGCSMILCI